MKQNPDLLYDKINERISEAISLGLIEAVSDHVCCPCVDRISEAISLGLIEARHRLSRARRGAAISEAISLGLIEALDA